MPHIVARFHMESTPPADSSARNAAGLRALLSRPSVLCLLLVLALMAVYWPVRHFEFLNYDDPEYVTANPRVLRGVTLDGLAWALTTSHADNWHPLTWFSHMLDVDVFGPSPAGPHLVNVLWHTANTLLLFFVLRRLTGAVWRSALVAALFGLHPLHVESVAWISERKDVLSTFFAMLALWAYADYAQGAEGRGRKTAGGSEGSRFESNLRPLATGFRPLSYVLALAFFALGLMSKPMLVTLPFVLLLLDYWPLRRSGKWEAGSEKEFDSRGLRVGGKSPETEGEPTFDPRPSTSLSVLAFWREKMPFFALSAISSTMTYLAQKRTGAVVSLSGLSLEGRIENALISYARYIGKTFWPNPLLVPYPHPGHWSWEWVALGVTVTLAGCGLAIAARRRWPFVFTGWFWFFGTLVPVIGLVQVGHQSLADRYTYFPSVGLFIAVVWGLAALASWARVPTAVASAVAALVLVACVIRTSNQLPYWQNSGTLFRHALACSERNYLAHDYLGGHLEAQGNWSDAILEFQAALNLNSHDAVSYSRLGVCHLHQGDLALAEQDFLRSLELDPRNATTWINFGALRLRQGRAAEAGQQFRKALELEPDSGEALERLADALVAQQRYSEAILNYESALRLRSADASLWNRLGNALFHEKRFADAMNCYQAGLQLKPTSVELLSNLGAVQFELGKFEEARRSYVRALELDPANAQAHNNLANALFRENQLDEAAKEYQRALEINPQLVEALNNLGWLRVQKEDYSGALSCFQRALELRPADAAIWIHLANVLSRMGRMEEAQRACHQALVLNPNSPEAHLEAGKIEARRGRTDLAARHFSEALRLKPDDEEARQAMNELQGSGATTK